MNAPNHENRVAGPRLVAIVGPFQSGKTSLLEGILARGGAVARQGSVREGTTRRRFKLGGAQPRDERRAQRRQH